MAFNAQWKFEHLARESGQAVPSLLLRLQSDFQGMVRTCPVFRLSVTDNGNCFLLHDEAGDLYEPPPEAGLYSIFTKDSVIYFGEATDLCRRQLKDPDNTADSTKTFDNQGRAILKLIAHRGWARELGLYPVFMQVYAGSCALVTGEGQTFEQVYKVARFSKALEGAMALFDPRPHSEMLERLAVAVAHTLTAA